MGGIRRVRQPLLDVVAVLVQAHREGESLHGWAIVKATHRSGPTVYRILDRLEVDGWIVGTWENHPEPGRPPRRWYMVTGTGAVEMPRLLAQRQTAVSR